MTHCTSTQSFSLLSGPSTVAQVIANSGRPLDAGTAWFSAGGRLIQIKWHLSIAFTGDGT